MSPDRSKAKLGKNSGAAIVNMNPDISNYSFYQYHQQLLQLKLNKNKIEKKQKRKTSFLKPLRASAYSISVFVFSCFLFFTPQSMLGVELDEHGSVKKSCIIYTRSLIPLSHCSAARSSLSLYYCWLRWHLSEKLWKSRCK